MDNKIINRYKFLFLIIINLFIILFHYIDGISFVIANDSSNSYEIENVSISYKTMEQNNNIITFNGPVRLTYNKNIILSDELILNDKTNDVEFIGNVKFFIIEKETKDVEVASSISAMKKRLDKNNDGLMYTEIKQYIEPLSNKSRMIVDIYKTLFTWETKQLYGNLREGKFYLDKIKLIVSDWIIISDKDAICHTNHNITIKDAKMNLNKNDNNIITIKFETMDMSPVFGSTTNNFDIWGSNASFYLYDVHLFTLPLLFIPSKEKFGFKYKYTKGEGSRNVNDYVLSKAEKSDIKKKIIEEEYSIFSPFGSDKSIDQVVKEEFYRTLDNVKLDFEYVISDDPFLTTFLKTTLKGPFGKDFEFGLKGANREKTLIFNAKMTLNNNEIYSGNIMLKSKLVFLDLITKQVLKDSYFLFEYNNSKSMLYKNKETIIFGTNIFNIFNLDLEIDTNYYNSFISFDKEYLKNKFFVNTGLTYFINDSSKKYYVPYPKIFILTNNISLFNNKIYMTGELGYSTYSLDIFDEKKNNDLIRNTIMSSSKYNIAFLIDSKYIYLNFLKITGKLNILFTYYNNSYNYPEHNDMEGRNKFIIDYWKSSMPLTLKETNKRLNNDDNQTYKLILTNNIGAIIIINRFNIFVESDFVFNNNKFAVDTNSYVNIDSSIFSNYLNNKIFNEKDIKNRLPYFNASDNPDIDHDLEGVINIGLRSIIKLKNNNIFAEIFIIELDQELLFNREFTNIIINNGNRKINLFKNNNKSENILIGFGNLNFKLEIPNIYNYLKCNISISSHGILGNFLPEKYRIYFGSHIINKEKSDGTLVRNYNPLYLPYTIKAEFEIIDSGIFNGTNINFNIAQGNKGEFDDSTIGNSMRNIQDTNGNFYGLKKEQNNLLLPTKPMHEDAKFNCNLKWIFNLHDIYKNTIWENLKIIFNIEFIPFSKTTPKKFLIDSNKIYLNNKNLDEILLDNITKEPIFYDIEVDDQENYIGKAEIIDEYKKNKGRFLFESKSSLYKKIEFDLKDSYYPKSISVDLIVMNLLSLFNLEITLGVKKEIIINNDKSASLKVTGAVRKTKCTNSDIECYVAVDKDKFNIDKEFRYFVEEYKFFYEMSINYSPKMIDVSLEHIIGMSL